MEIRRIEGDTVDHWIGKPMDMGVVKTISKCEQKDGSWKYFGYNYKKQILFIVSKSLIHTEHLNE